MPWRNPRHGEDFRGRPGREPPRESPSRRGYGRHHQRWRRLLLKRSPICVGFPRAWHGHEFVQATVADHIVPLRLWDENPGLAYQQLVALLVKHGRSVPENLGPWSEENFQPLCADCHGRKSRLER